DVVDAMLVRGEVGTDLRAVKTEEFSFASLCCRGRLAATQGARRRGHHSRALASVSRALKGAAIEMQDRCLGSSATRSRPSRHADIPSMASWSPNAPALRGLAAGAARLQESRNLSVVYGAPHGR